MDEMKLDDIERQILEAVCRRVPFERNPPQYETRGDLTGSLRLALNEYDRACGALIRLGLIASDQPFSGECDFITPRRAGRRLVSAPPQEGSLAIKVLEQLRTAPAGNWLAAGEVLAALGVEDAAYQTACEALFTWELIERQGEEEDCYARVRAV